MQRGLPYPEGHSTLCDYRAAAAGTEPRNHGCFRLQWQKFAELGDPELRTRQFLDWIHPIQPGFLRGKAVLDAGCGMGRFARVSAELGATAVLGVDASDSVEAARRSTRDMPNVHVVQADILRLPLRRASEANVEFIFSIGVLHHLDHPQSGFSSLVEHLTNSGSILVWVYGRENNDWIVEAVNPVRTALTSRLPRKVLYVLAWSLSAGLYPFLKGVYGPANICPRLGWAKQALFYNDYMAWLGQFPFTYTHNVVFDHLVAPVAFYLRREEVQAWFDAAGLEMIDISWRNRNSWRAHGRLPDLAIEEHDR